MKHILILLIFCSFTLSSIGQGLYKGTKGKASFFSDALLEDIKAETGEVTSAYNTATNEVAVLILIKTFSFEKALMQEHFNENYLESDKYPEATFTGKVDRKQLLEIGQTQHVTIKGNLTIHGVTKPREINSALTLNADGTLSVTGKFNIQIADHKIKVPSLVFQKIAEVVEVSFSLLLNNAKP